jgi:hypothetical protein
MGLWQGLVPVAVRSLAVEPRSCYWNEPIAYDVEIRNVSQYTIALPWSRIAPDDPLPSSSATVFTTMMISLRVLDDPTASLGVGEALYRDAGDPLVMRRVRPGESVMVRLPGTCVINFATVPPPVSATGSQFKVSVLATLQRPEPDSVAVITSNELEITVSRIDEQ